MFRDLWARDFGFALPGILDIGDIVPSKKSFDVLFLHQHQSGQIPRFVSPTPSNLLRGPLTFNIFDIRQSERFPLTPSYTTYAGTVDVDSSAITIISYDYFLEKTQAHPTFYHNMVCAADWLAKQGVDMTGSIRMQAFSGWEDSINKTKRKLSFFEEMLGHAGRMHPDDFGSDIYQNMLAKEAFRVVACRAKDAHTQKKNAQREKTLEQSIQSTFWNEDGYFNDFVGEGGNNLNAAGNLLAILYNVATPKQTKSILEKIEEFEMNKPFGLKTRNKKVPLWRIGRNARFVGISDYQDTTHWLWLGALYAQVLAMNRRKSDARYELEKIENLIEKQGQIHEVYQSTGKPLKSWFFKSEEDFAWSSGMLLHAMKCAEY